MSRVILEVKPGKVNTIEIFTIDPNSIMMSMMARCFSEVSQHSCNFPSLAFIKKVPIIPGPEKLFYVCF